MLNVPGPFQQSDFRHNSDSGTGTFITTNIPCFTAGTRIRTSAGEIAVERLKIGDRLPTLLRGGNEPVTWIGRRQVDCARHPRPKKVWPVRVSAHAFGLGTPQRDLLLSPDHAVLVRDILVPVRYLINGTTIVQIPRSGVTYYHVELAQHDVIWAEGLAAEIISRQRRPFEFLQQRGNSDVASRLRRFVGGLWLLASSRRRAGIGRGQGPRGPTGGGSQSSLARPGAARWRGTPLKRETMT